MALIHNLGFPRIGKDRELKFALENFWRGDSTEQDLQQMGLGLRAEHWQYQRTCDFVPVGDFSFYDQVLDTSFLFGHIPTRVAELEGTELEQYFRIARGRAKQQDSHPVFAGEMTKWFDTNYHYIVPELSQGTEFCLNPSRLLTQIQEAKALGLAIKPVLLGPVSYLWLSKCKDQSQALDYLEALTQEYKKLLNILAQEGLDWVQIDEPILVTELTHEWRQAFEKTYYRLQTRAINILLATYFGSLGENLRLACDLPVAGLHIDTVSAPEETAKVVDWLPSHKILSLGVISGRNIWKADLTSIIDWLEPIAERIGNRLWLAPSCSLLHVPVDLNSETQLDTEISNWLAFATQKLEELNILKTALNKGRDQVATELNNNALAIQQRATSDRVHNHQVKKAVAAISPKMGERQADYTRREQIQSAFNLPAYPTTTIGSFPQTKAIRQTRLDFKKNRIEPKLYQQKMQQEISHCIRQQEELELDVLVHGEAERNDMVEYFGQQLEGYIFSQYGWVQSYGSRCVKPPIIYGDISRPAAMTTEWIQYAQSLTHKPVKGMLTGPVTMLNWSFVRDDQNRSETCYQLALAIRAEVLDLENSGVNIIQIDEAALREGLPLRKSEWESYLNWAVNAFKLCANGVQNETQIHTHMCYSEFNDIIDAIAKMDADVITIETSRSDMELLDVFDEYQYPNQIGPGVYDIHSPNIPTVEQMVALMKKAAEKIPAERLWVNPDCGLKTRQWKEVLPALKNMVQAAKQLRADHSDNNSAAA